MGATYADRFVRAVADQLPESFTVTHDGGIVTATHSAGATLLGRIAEPADKRGPVDFFDVSRWMSEAMNGVRRRYLRLPYGSSENFAASELIKAVRKFEDEQRDRYLNGELD